MLIFMDRIYFRSKLVLINLALFCMCVTTGHTVSDAGVPVTVIRRFSGDIIQYTASDSHISCRDANATFLVSDRRCIKNQQLFDGE